jgi:hypothetical protein
MPVFCRFSPRAAQRRRLSNALYWGRKAAWPACPTCHEISVLAPQFGITTDLVFAFRPVTLLLASGTLPEFGIIRIKPNWGPPFPPVKAAGNARQLWRSSGRSEGSHMNTKQSLREAILHFAGVDHCSQAVAEVELKRLQSPRATAATLHRRMQSPIHTGTSCQPSPSLASSSALSTATAS